MNAISGRFEMNHFVANKNANFKLISGDIIL